MQVPHRGQGRGFFVTQTLLNCSSPMQDSSDPVRGDLEPRRCLSGSHWQFLLVRVGETTNSTTFALG